MTTSLSLATNLFLLWPLKFDFGHHIFGVGGQPVTKNKIPLRLQVQKVQALPNYA
jgi:hypothetical protein